jgi:protein tyrosine/serine phosphatase
MLKGVDDLRIGGQRSKIVGKAYSMKLPCSLSGVIIALALVVVSSAATYGGGCEKRTFTEGISLRAQTDALKKVSLASEHDPQIYRSRVERNMPCSLAMDDRVLLPNFDHVTKNVYRGGQPFLRSSKDQSAFDGLTLLRELGVTDIIALRGMSDGSDQSKHPISIERRRSVEEGISFHSIPLLSWDFGISLFSKSFSESEPDVACAVALILKLKREGRVIYVHCKHGADRTTVVFAMLRLLEGAPVEVAMMEAEDHSFSSFQRGMRNFISRYKEPVRLEEFRRQVNKLSEAPKQICPTNLVEKVS